MSEWPSNSITSIETPEEVSHVANVFDLSLVVSFDRFSSFHKLLRVTAWIYCFISNCKGDNVINSAYLLVSELHAVERYWNSVSQADYFSPEIKLLRSKSSLPKSSSLLPLHPLLDDHGLLVSPRLSVGGESYVLRLSFCLSFCHHREVTFRSPNLNIACSTATSFSPLIKKVTFYRTFVYREPHKVWKAKKVRKTVFWAYESQFAL